MRNNKIFAVIVGLALVFILFQINSLFKGSQSSKSIESGAQSESVPSVVKTEKPKFYREQAIEKNVEFNTLDFISPETKLPALQSDTVMQEISSRQYSEDAFVELYTLQGVSQLCSNADEIKEWLTKEYGQMNNQQLVIMDKLKVKCSEHTDQYPTASLLNRKEIEEKYKATSHLGKLIQQRKHKKLLSIIEIEELEKNIMLAAIKSGNSYVAIDSSLSYRFGKQVTNDAAMIINSQDQFYLSQINQLAITHMACGFASAEMCEPEGYLMVLVCSQEPDSCGMDFMTWFENNTLPGMRNDVALMIEHLSIMAQ